MHRLYEEYWGMPDHEPVDRWLLRGTLVCLVITAVIYPVIFGILIYQGKPLPTCFAIKSALFCTSIPHG